MNAAATSPLDSLRRLIAADAEVARALGEIGEVDAFAERAAAIAAGRSIQCEAGQVAQAINAIPAALSKLAPVPVAEAQAPTLGWLPLQFQRASFGPALAWTYFGGAPLTGAFFEADLRAALARPINRLVRLATPLTTLPEQAAALPTASPTGFIFHMSRCGSTLVAQMLGALDRTAILSEPSPLDDAVVLDRHLPGLTSEAHAALIRATLSALGQTRAGEHRLFLKPHAWHARLIPVFRRLYPSTPWVFLYREPAEVMASQVAKRGTEVIPGMLEPSRIGVDPAGLDPDAYCAEALAKMCEAAADAYEAAGGGLLVNYAELPGAIFSRILPHFCIEPAPHERVAITEVAARDAKRPGSVFTPDAERKRAESGAALQVLCEARLAPIHARLEALRLKS